MTEELGNPRVEGVRLFALRFISGKYQGSEFVIPHQGALTIGRSSDLDLVLVEDMVSRHHAKVLCQDSRVTIEDMGSTNGTFVNGERVVGSSPPLHDGDRVLIGTNIIKLVESDGKSRSLAEVGSPSSEGEDSEDQDGRESAPYESVAGGMAAAAAEANGAVQIRRGGPESASVTAQSLEDPMTSASTGGSGPSGSASANDPRPGDVNGSGLEGAQVPPAGVRARRTTQVRTMSGAIEEIAIPDLLQLFSTSRKSGVLSIQTDEDEGRIYLEQGAVVFASVNEREEVAPLKSLIRILTWECGNFDMEPAYEREFPTRLEMSTEGILMEGFRQIDELRRLSGQLPSLKSPLVISSPLEQPLRDLKPEELDLMQCVLNHGTLNDVMNHSRDSDVVVGQRVLKLIEKGYIQPPGS